MRAWFASGSRSDGRDFAVAEHVHRGAAMGNQLADALASLVPGAELLDVRSLAADGDTTDDTHKIAGYGLPRRVRLRTPSGERTFVLHLQRCDSFGHDRRSDRAAAQLLAWDTFGRIPARERESRLATIHGDVHPFNVLFGDGAGFHVLDASRGCAGDPADDVSAMAINYVFFAVDHPGAWDGALRDLWRRFFDVYLRLSRDEQLLEVIAPTSPGARSWSPVRRFIPDCRAKRAIASCRSPSARSPLACSSRPGRTRCSDEQRRGGVAHRAAALGQEHPRRPARL